MIKIAPSLLAADFSRLGEEVKRVEKAGAEMLHLDVMDGAFVPNISFGPAVIGSVRGISDIVFDVHLMINDPGRYIGVFADNGADIITVHYESCDDVIPVLKQIRARGIKAAVSVKPKTSAGVLKPLLPYVDMILIMTVEPGFGGQSFIEDALVNVRTAKEMAVSSGYDIDIEVDGGINPATAAKAAANGANIFVAGSSVFKAADMSESVKSIREAAEKAYK